MENTLLSDRFPAISLKKIFLFIVILEVMTLVFLLWGDKYTLAYYFGILVLPFILLIIPLEPIIGIPMMLTATGFDFFAQITTTEDNIFNFTYFHLVMVITFASVFLNQCLQYKTRFPRVTVAAPVIAFLAFMAVSLIYTPLFLSGFMELVRLSVLCALAYSMVLCVNSRKKLVFVVWSFILIPVGVSLFTIYEIFTEGSFFATQIIRVATELGLNVYRSTGTFHNPNYLACFLMIGITIAFGMLFVKNIHVLVKTLLFFCIGVMGIALISSFSRGGWLSTFCAVFVLIMLHRKWSYLGIFTGIMILLLIIISIKFPEIVLSTFGRLLSIFDPTSEASSSSRLSLIKSGIWMWQDHPIFGVGASGFPYYAYDYLDPNVPLNLANVKEAHTLQTKILAEEGLIGITIALWFLVTVIFDSIRSIKTTDDDFLKKVQISLVALFIGFLVNFTFASDLLNNNFWITVGLMYALPLIVMKEQSPGKT